MSSMRFGRQQQHPKAKRTLRPKRTAPSKKEWVSTVNDLSVHKLTPAEQSHRHEMMKSHNKVAAQWELREKALKRHLRHGSPSPLDETSYSIIREVLSDQMMLKDVLARSDKTMSVVKDIFGDAPRRQTGHPSVTKAPNHNSDSVLPVFQRPDPPTELSLLSQSMMDSQALNELEYSDEEDCNQTNPSCLKFDVIRRANIRKMKSRATGKVVKKQSTNGIPATPSADGRAPDPAALNATVAVQRVKHLHKQTAESNDEEIISQVLNPEHHSCHTGRINCSVRKTNKCADRSSDLNGSSFATLSGDQSSLGLLQFMLGQVEAELDCFSPDSKPTSDQSSQPHRTKGLTGFSVALVSTLERLVHLFKQSNVKAASERRQFEEELKKQQGLIEALTAENTALREEMVSLQSIMQQKISEMEEKVDTVVLVLSGTEMPFITTPEPAVPAAGLSRVVAERDHGQTQVAPAAPLSPRQGDHWPHHPEAHLVPAERLYSSENINTLASNLTCLPSTSSVSLSSLSSKLSAEAMMAEIAQLSRQNELIKAQLSQTKSSASGGSASPSNTYLEEQPLSCGSSPQSAVERTMSGNSWANSTEPTEAQAETSLLNTTSVEQRLLELNKQSAAARTRLLEIIDQQKHIASTKLTPSVSPVSPVTDRRESSDMSQLQEPMIHSKQTTSNEPSLSQSIRGKANENVTKDKKLSSPEGFFSLSTHLRLQVP